MPVDEKKLAELRKKARETRKTVLQMIAGAASGHPGGSLSCIEIMVALFERLRLDPKNPHWKERDRFVMSKGHAAPVLYACLADKGFFPKEELKTLRKLGSRLQGHPETTTPGVDVPTGSLGHGLSMANGMALAGKLDKAKWRVYALLGDGECDEGQVWEAAATAAHHKLDNVVAIVDRNMVQLDGPTEEIKRLGNLAEKFRSFGWNAIEVDGHDFGQIMGALDAAEGFKGKPTALIALTVKGKGVSFAEGKAAYHGKPIVGEELEKALIELEGMKND
ncbi:MAG: transketolase [Candidatus Micrarchaeota archaeon]|nr:transketolase [Candidatus Micrarchaeota archaeon]